MVSILKTTFVEDTVMHKDFKKMEEKFIDAFWLVVEVLGWAVAALLFIKIFL